MAADTVLPLTTTAQIDEQLTKLSRSLHQPRQGPGRLTVQQRWQVIDGLLDARFAMTAAALARPEDAARH